MIIVDDEVDTGGSIAQAVKVVQENNARDIYLAFIHPLFSRDAAERLAALRGGELGVTDARAASREMVALIAVRDGLERCAGLFPADGAKGATAHAA